jgi:hypothetical protein
MLCSADVTTAVCRRQYGKMLNLWLSCQALGLTTSWVLWEEAHLQRRRVRRNTPSQLRNTGGWCALIREAHPEFVEFGLWAVVAVHLEHLVDGPDYLARPAGSLRSDTDECPVVSGEIFLRWIAIVGRARSNIPRPSQSVDSWCALDVSPLLNLKFSGGGSGASSPSA